ncbi:MAG: iron donor protein CyaY [Alphaproteobacteria bacterium]|nr:iron donor protein CyaY [Alphaproteobacteria bacterium]
MDERSFETAAAALLAQFFETFEDSLRDDVDVELRDGILTVELTDGRQFIVNKHAASREIWLSSPVSGAHHFSWRDGAWRSTRAAETLGERLVADLGMTVGPTAATLSLD